MDYVRKENEFSIYLYCLEKDIDFKRDKKKDQQDYVINMVYVTICAMDKLSGNFPLKKKIISIKSNYRSTYIFTFLKKNG